MWTAGSAMVSVQVFDLMGRATYREVFSPIPNATRQQTFQNVCSYYDVRMVVRRRWGEFAFDKGLDSTGASITVEACSAVWTTTVRRWQATVDDRPADGACPRCSRFIDEGDRHRRRCAGGLLRRATDLEEPVSVYLSEKVAWDVGQIRTATERRDVA